MTHRRGIGLLMTCVAVAGLGGTARAQLPGKTIDLFPTHRATSAVDLERVLRSDFKGRVIVPKDANWAMVNPCSGKGDFDECIATPITYVPIKSGVHLVGERGLLGRRPKLVANYRAEGYPLFAIEDRNVRVEGLELRGPYLPRDRKKELPGVTAIKVIQDPVAHVADPKAPPVTIVDNEIAQFSVAVDVVGAVRHDEPRNYNSDEECRRRANSSICPRFVPADAGILRVERNYIHHNQMQGGGYGVAVGGSGYFTAIGNVFEYHNHSIAADGQAYQGYVARHNYVLESVDTYGKDDTYPHSFDVHGRGNAGSKKFSGGRAGTYFEIAYNTFRGEQDYGFGGRLERAAFKLRGRPEKEAKFIGNVAVHDDLDEAVEVSEGAADKFSHGGNRFDVDYSSEIATGDFDGDGRSDVFIGNGTAWFFSRGGVRPWEFMRPSDKRIGDLGFADIDNDARTDVIYRDGAGRLSYAKSGSAAGLTPVASPAVPVPMRDLRFGDFDGDRLTDMFHTSKGEWYVWFGATRMRRAVNTSSKPLADLLFGEFDDVRGTDVVGIINSGWAVSSGAATPWAPLNGKLTKSFAGAVAADVDSSGKSDIVFGKSNGSWRYSRDGRGPLETLRRGRGTMTQQRVGRFVIGAGESIVGFGYAPHKNRLGIWFRFKEGLTDIQHSHQNLR